MPPSPDPGPSEPTRALARDGFAVLRGFLSPEGLAEVRAELDRYLRDVAPGAGRDVYLEEPGRPETLKQLQRMHEHDARFRRLLHEGPFAELARELLAGDVVGKNLQLFRKAPGEGRATPAHQDGHYFMIEPLEAVTMWFALDAVDDTNGRLRYVRGSHLAPLREHARTETLGFSQGIVDFGTEADLRAEVALDAEPGDLLVHHAGTIHRADANRSADRPRRALGFIYYSVRAREDAERHAAYQRRLHDELARAGRLSAESTRSG